MDKSIKKINVGFIVPTSQAWMGGVNYFKNLFFAISSIQDNNIKIFIFVGKKADKEIKKIFSAYGKIIEDSILDRKSIKWFSTKILGEFFSSNILLDRLLKKYNIHILSHTSEKNLKCCKIISWIPDFQHIHLPHMFLEKNIKNRNKEFLESIRVADKVILSSYDAFEDFKKFSPEYEFKAAVLQFVSQPEKKYHDFTSHDKELLLKKYKIPEEFYFIPNQFWKHKNHKIILECIKLLNNDALNNYFVFSGYMQDTRHKEYMSELKNYIDNNNLSKNVFLLGLIDYKDVFKLIRFSKAVINPSLFEGWSSTVEECKSIGKNLILSDINVHKEQCPDAMFFDRHSAVSLKEILSNYTITTESLNKENDLQEKTRNFGQQYLNIIKDVYYE